MNEEPTAEELLERREIRREAVKKNIVATEDKILRLQQNLKFLRKSYIKLKRLIKEGHKNDSIRNNGVA
jgi:predicted DNA-binding protein YlxM (UPF0122 family)